MTHRGDLTDEQWERLQPLLPPQRYGKGTKGGRTSLDHRTTINGILWILRTGAPWADLPERYGKRSSVSNRYSRWIKTGIWDHIYDMVKAQADARGELDWEVHHVDATVVRAHQHAAGAKKGTQKPRHSGAVGVGSAPKSICV
jgi:transposase